MDGYYLLLGEQIEMIDSLLGDEDEDILWDQPGTTIGGECGADDLR